MVLKMSEILFPFLLTLINWGSGHAIITNILSYNNKLLYLSIFLLLVLLALLCIQWYTKRSVLKIQQEKLLIEEKILQQAKELCNKEEWLKGILGSLHESMICVCDRNGIYRNIWGTPELEKLYGIKCDDLIGKSITNQFPPQKAQTFLSNIQTVYDFGKPHVDRYVFHCPNGEFWHDISLKPMRNTRGEINAVVGFIRDITKHRIAENELRYSEEKYRSLIEHSNDAIYLLFQGKFVVINKKFEEMFGYRQDETNAPDFDFMDLVALNSKAYVTERAQRLAEGQELVLPLRYEFTALARNGKKIEAEVSVTYVNYQGKIATQGILRDITDRKRAEEQEKFIANILQASKVAVIGINIKRQFIIWNRGAEELLGWKAEEIMGKKGSMIVPKEYLHEINLILENDLKKGNAVEFETVRLCKDGRRVNVFFTTSPIKNANNQIIGFLGVLVDITERKKAEKALQESEEKYRTLIEQSNDAIYLLFQDKFVIINKKFEEILGYTQEDVRAQNFNIMDLVAPKSKTLVKERRRKQLAGEELSPRYEFSCITKDGREIEFEVSLSYISYNGKIATQGVLRDITERKRMEQALRDSEAHFHSVFEGAKDAIFVESTEGEILDVNSAACNLLGYSYDELVGMKVKNIIPAKIREKLPQIVEHHKSGKGVFIQNTENIHKDGRKIPVEVTTNIVKVNGEPRVIAIVRDISERKKAETEKIDAIRQTVSALAKAVAERDPYTPEHSANVAKISVIIARRMGWNEDRVLGLRLAAELHDIGKIGVPAEILAKPARLNQLEYTLIREHVQKGYDILKDIKFPFPVAEAVFQNHELLDGSGYPNKLKGEAIIMEARILKVADMLESFTSTRPYRPPLGLDNVLEKLGKDAGVLYDKDVVETVFNLIDDAGGKAFWE